jgi:hypothetical protein
MQPMSAEKTIEGMTRDQAQYNVYAFGQDVKRYTRKRDSARKAHTRAAWEKKIEEANTYRDNNQRRLQAFDTSPD